MSDGKPPEKPTISMKAVQVPETQLDEILRTMKEVKATVGTIADDQIEMRKDISGLREDVDGLQQREGDRSMRVRQESGVNLQQDATIGEMKNDMRTLKVDMQALHVKTDLQTKVLTKWEAAADALWSNKAVQGAIITLIVAAAAAGTAFFTSLGHR